MASFKEAIDKNKQVKPKAAKSTVPVLEDVPEEITAAAGEYIKKAKEKKVLEADLASLNGTISEYVAEIQDQRAFKGEFNNSYAIPAGDVNLTVTTKNVFKINPEDEPRLKTVFGEKYNDFIEEKVDVTLKGEVFKNDALQEELMELLGDNFSRFFDVTTSLKVKENFDEKVYAFAKTAKKLSDIRTLVEPIKATLK